MMYANRTLLILLGSFITGTIAWFAMAAFLGERDHVKGAAIILTGCTMTAADLILRWLNHDRLGWPLLNPDVGASIRLIPAWFIGLIPILGGLQLAFGK